MTPLPDYLLEEARKADPVNSGSFDSVNPGFIGGVEWLWSRLINKAHDEAPHPIHYEALRIQIEALKIKIDERDMEQARQEAEVDALREEMGK